VSYWLTSLRPALVTPYPSMKSETDLVWSMTILTQLRKVSSADGTCGEITPLTKTSYERQIRLES
jgi:hypothetical protein